MAHVPGAKLSTRFEHWTDRLASASTDTLPATELYAGEHWAAVRRLLGAHPDGRDVDLWVCSAGYGLIPANALVAPYSATFSGGQMDSVPRPTEEWWEHLCGWKGPSNDWRSLSDLVASEPTARILLILSSEYLRACRNDIIEASKKLDATGRLSIISIGAKRDKELDEFLLPGNADLQVSLGGTLQALNARTAEYLISEGVLDHDEMSDRLRILLTREVTKPPARRLMTDADIRTFIRIALDFDRTLAQTRLLRRLREDNCACEQGRFARLFSEVSVRS